MQPVPNRRRHDATCNEPRRTEHDTPQTEEITARRAADRTWQAMTQDAMRRTEHGTTRRKMNRRRQGILRTDQSTTREATNRTELEAA